MTSVKVAGQKISNTDYVLLTNVGWAIKEQKAVVRISAGVKELLTNIFNKGAKDRDQKAMPADVVERIKKAFPVSEWVKVQTVRGYFFGWLCRKRDFKLAKGRVKTMC